MGYSTSDDSYKIMVTRKYFRDVGEYNARLEEVNVEINRLSAIVLEEFKDVYRCGSNIQHRKYGLCKITYIDDRCMYIEESESKTNRVMNVDRRMLDELDLDLPSAKKLDELKTQKKEIMDGNPETIDFRRVMRLQQSGFNCYSHIFDYEKQKRKQSQEETRNDEAGNK